VPLEPVLDGEDRGFRVERVEDRLDQQQIAPPVTSPSTAEYTATSS
jgi:hypothetical protein